MIGLMLMLVFSLLCSACGAEESAPEPTQATSNYPLLKASYHRVDETKGVFTPIAISLYEDGTAQLPLPPYSSYSFPGGTYSIIGDELRIYDWENRVAARFEIVNDSTLVVRFMEEPFDAKPGDKYWAGYGTPSISRQFTVSHPRTYA